MPENEKNASNYKWFWEKLDLYLRSQDLKQTKQRKVVIEFFLELNTHVTAERLHEVTREKGHNIGLATIYRTLNLLREAGLVEQHSFADGRSVFELDEPGAHHDHLVCLDCGAVIEFENREIENLQTEIANKHDFKLESHRLDLYGSCTKKSCDRKAGKVYN